jgi:hypothetical protein
LRAALAFVVLIASRDGDPVDGSNSAAARTGHRSAAIGPHLARQIDGPASIGSRRTSLSRSTLGAFIRGGLG